jgi:hypothetical protein
MSIMTGTDIGHRAPCRDSAAAGRMDDGVIKEQDFVDPAGGDQPDATICTCFVQDRMGYPRGQGFAGGCGTRRLDS